MRSHAKASTAGSTQRQAAGLGRTFRGAFSIRGVFGDTAGSGAPSRSRSGLAAGLVAALSVSAFLLSAAPAFAATVTDRPLLFSFDGSDTTAGHLVVPSSIAVDNSSGAVYTAEESPSSQEPGHHAVSKFNSAGSAATFSATGASSLFGTPGGAFMDSGVYVAVDNSGGAGQGRLYVVDNFGEGRLSAFAPDGTFLWENPEVGSFPQDVAVDSAGRPWVLFSSSVKEFAGTGSPPAQIGSFAVSEGRTLDIDAGGNVYVAGFSGLKKYVGGVLSATIDSDFDRDVVVNQAVPAGHVFVAQGGTFKEYDGSGGEVGTYGAAALKEGKAIAYNPTLDRVYVTDSGLEAVEAFGPSATGTTPDPTIEPTTVIGSGTAEFHGEVNPQSVPNGYYFEWSDFEKVFRSPLVALPEDNVGHSVSFKAKNLLGNVNWKVRLVAVNTAGGLRSASPLDEFTPPQAVTPPDITIGDPSGATSSSAVINGTINPHEDSVRWQARTSTNLSCEAGSFAQQGLQYLAGGEVNTPLNVEFEMKDLLPAQHYCVFLEANNSFQLFGTGSVTEVKEFTTEAIPPSGVETSFVAPRTDTTARINGLVNPEGEADFTYHFELSEDGVNWTTRPDLEVTTDARVPIFVADELTGLKPDTTYYYRFAGAENEAGPSISPPGDVRTFTTRTAAEMVRLRRGIELVNNPDKGNQDILAVKDRMRDPGLSGDGNKAIWQVAGGAPGGYNGTFSAFLAKRTPGGWQSRSIAPPAAEQVGGGSEAYTLITNTPDFSHFIFGVTRGLLGETPEETRVRVDADQHEETLRNYQFVGASRPGGVDRSEDGAHVLAIDNISHQLEDIGGGSAEVVSIMPDETPSSCGLYPSPSFVGGPSSLEPEGSGGVSDQWRPGYSMIDRVDGSLVYFEAKPNGECGKPWGLYVRDREAEETTLIDPGAKGKDVSFVRATPDGSSGYFLTFSQLESADANEDADLYRWDEESDEANCVTCVLPDAALQVHTGNGIYRSVLISNDFSHIYFESDKELVAGQPPATSGASVYLLSGGTVRYVAASGTFERDLTSYEVQLSTDGDVLVWSSRSEKTADRLALGNFALYRYDDRSGSVECVSCVSGGVTESGLGGSTEGSAFQLSADGSTVAFVSKDDLLPQDVNRGADVYEWRSGVRRLVTDGVSEFAGGFASPNAYGISADGSTILFSVADPGLTGFEQDRVANLYVARVGGGFEPPPAVVHCDGDSCQGPLQAPPSPSSSASAGFSGAGNLAPAARKRRPCVHKRGKSKQRCIRKHKRHALQARANRNAGGAK